MTEDQLERFHAKTVADDTGECVLWIGARKPAGYGNVRQDNRCRLVHRVAYEHWVGPIPDGLQIDHLCRNRSCVNPHHLEAVTGIENRRRGLGVSLKTHCPKGHLYDEANTRYEGTSGARSRVCRICRKAKNKKGYDARRARGLPK